MNTYSKLTVKITGHNGGVCPEHGGGAVLLLLLALLIPILSGVCTLQRQKNPLQCRKTKKQGSETNGMVALRDFFNPITPFLKMKSSAQQVTSQGHLAGKRQSRKLKPVFLPPVQVYQTLMLKIKKRKHIKDK